MVVTLATKVAQLLKAGRNYLTNTFFFSLKFGDYKEQTIAG